MKKLILLIISFLCISEINQAQTLDLDKLTRPLTPEACIETGNDYYKEGNYSKAIVYYRKVVEETFGDWLAAMKFRSDDRIYYKIARCYLKLGNYTKADEYFKAAAKLGNVDAQERLIKQGKDWDDSSY